MENKKIYRLHVTLNTDGDYCCDYYTPILKYDGEGHYDLLIGWEDKETAIIEGRKILTEMKSETTSSRDYVQEDIDSMFDEAIECIGDGRGCLSYMSGNYDGTCIWFFPVDIVEFIVEQNCDPISVIDELAKNNLLPFDTFTPEYKIYTETLNEQVFKPNGLKLIVVEDENES